MRYFFSLFGLVALHFATCAQITITAEDFGQPGEEFVYQNDTAATGEIILFSTIDNAPWNFSNFENDRRDTVLFLDPAATAFADSFAQANLCIRDMQGWAFLDKNTQKADLLGMVAQLETQNLIVPFDEPMTYMLFPVVYQMQFSDQQSREIRSTPEDLGIDFTEMGLPTNPDSIRIDVNYSIDGEIDDYGALTTNFGQFETLRETHTDHIGFSVYIYVYPLGWFTDPVYTDNIETQTYRWLAKEAGFPVAQATVRNDTLLNMRILETQDPSALHEPAQQLFRLYPNPAHHQLFVESVLPLAGKAQLTNSSGKMVRTQQLSGKKCQILVADLPPGIYFVKIRNKKHTFVRQVIISNTR